MSDTEKSDDQKFDLFDELKKGGLWLEQEINERIHKNLNKEEILERLSAGTQPLARYIKALQEYSEIMSVPLNIPTKNDVANIAKVIIQIEEKLDALEGRLANLVGTSDSFQPAAVATENSDQKMEKDTAEHEQKRKKFKAKRIHTEEKLDALAERLANLVGTSGWDHKMKKETVLALIQSFHEKRKKKFKEKLDALERRLENLFGTSEEQNETKREPSETKRKPSETKRKPSEAKRKRHETKRHETKRHETKRHETKRHETKRHETRQKRNEKKRNTTKRKEIISTCRRSHLRLPEVRHTCRSHK